MVQLLWLLIVKNYGTADEQFVEIIFTQIEVVYFILCLDHQSLPYVKIKVCVLNRGKKKPIKTIMKLMMTYGQSFQDG